MKTENEHSGDHAGAESYSLAADVFFALTVEKTRILTEFLASTEEIDLERVQVGIELAPRNYLWFGRFHSPLDYWNSQYSHAAFLQGSIHRPGIVEYEDHGGVIPAHAAGAMFEGEILSEGSAFEYNFLFGVGTKLNDDGLSPLRLVDKLDTKNSFNVFSRLAYRPDDTAMTQLGIFSVYTDYLTDLASIDDLKQIIGGVYLYKTWMNFRLTSAAYLLNNDLIKNNTSNVNRFFAGYIHADYELSSQWLGYLRYEDSAGIKDDAYLSLFPEYAQRRGVIGARFDVNLHHAISLETAASLLHEGVSGTVTFQWSAVYP